ncbi:YafY family protein [Cohnella lubricantis]|uniref:YafY family transcriptional regulator n=1 Tax=Cohnella lubricantis TaxID=2163172 RepID=A0A841TAR6_9BACL|nr:YafY family protein [Cohnella lubricantis]MBB6677125.1 YafY family transcriptional regulator [Cohnella lubricantis]MBP2118972.1 putative DNA-binding transcriptional regulator YafY [Cohnella lubricantis]
MSKATNMLSILWLLRSGRRMTAQKLADELEIHIRTVYRCIDSLCASGVPIIADSGPNGGYRILDHFTESPLVFDTEEQKALVHASAFALEAGYPFDVELIRAIDKLKLYTNEGQLEQIERHSQGLDVIHPPSEPKQREWLRMLEYAAVLGRSLEMEYRKEGADAPAVRIFDPYGIVHWKGAWYAAGFCRMRSELRSFRVDRIIRLTYGEGGFERPPGFSAKRFLLGSLLPDTLGEETLSDVRIGGPQQALDLLCQHWLFGHALRERCDTEALFRIGEPTLSKYVPYYLLPYGRALTIHEPRRLVERMAEVSAELAGHYQNMKPAPTAETGKGEGCP